MFCFVSTIDSATFFNEYSIKRVKQKDGNDGISTFPISSKHSSRTAESSDEDIETEDKEITKKKPSLSKQSEATVVYANLPEKPKEMIEAIVSAKSIVKFMLISLASNVLFIRLASIVKFNKTMELLCNNRI